MNTEEKKITPGEAWEKFFNRLLLIIPQKLTTLLDGEKSERERHPLTIVVPIVIAILSVASITNMTSRASAHHPGVAADATGIAIAVLVPLAVFAAVHSKLSKGTRIAVWLIAVMFACVSAAIQFMVYAPSTGFQITFGLFEAVAFGAGVPIAECLLAVIEYLLLEQDAKMNKEREDQAEEKRQQKIKDEEEARKLKIEQTRQQEEEARQRQEEARQNAQDEEQKRILFEFEMEAKRLELEAKLEASRLTLAAKLQQKSVAKSGADASETSIARNKNTPVKKNPATARRNTLLKILQQHGDIGDTAFSEKLDVDRSTIYRDFKALEKDNIIHANGNGWAVGPKN